MNYLKDFELPFLKYAGMLYLWCHLKTKHSSDSLSALMGEVNILEEEILQKFGLPFSYRFSRILNDEALNVELDLASVKLLFKELKLQAKTHANSPVLTDIEVLNKARLNKLRHDDVLPELSLKLRCEPYYLYIYHIGFMKGDISAQSMLRDITIVAENRLSLTLQNLAEEKEWLTHKDYFELKKYKLLFLDDFLTNCRKFMEKFEDIVGVLADDVVVTIEKKFDEKK